MKEILIFLLEREIERLESQENWGHEQQTKLEQAKQYLEELHE